MWSKVTVPTIFSEGSRLNGDLAFEGSAQIFGSLEGNIEHRSLETLHIGKTAWIHGNIVSSGPVIVEGRVEGNITSSTKVRVLGSAVIQGDIHAPRVEVRPGAQMETHFKVGELTTAKKAA